LDIVKNMQIPRFSIGLGDRFGKEGVAQLRAVEKASAAGMEVFPVWNKSNREHGLTGTQPSDTRRSAEQAVAQAGWRGGYMVDADHIGVANVDRFLKSCDFFTLDVAEQIGRPAPHAEKTRLMEALSPWARRPWPDFGHDVAPGVATLESFLQEYGAAVMEAGKIYRRILQERPEDTFVTEVSTDEASEPQSPWVLFLLLGALSFEGVKVQTIAPKFTGHFHKGVDYRGNKQAFSKEFSQDLEAIRIAVREFQLPQNLKISIHSGSDKFSLYPIIRDAVQKQHAGFHLKTAGTTWLEELVGLAEHGGEGLSLVKQIYRQAHHRRDELMQPYASVVSIQAEKLPSPATVKGWSSSQFVSALRHDPSQSAFCPNFRQLLHLAFKIAAEMREPFFQALDQARELVEKNVTTNLWERHLRPLGVT
jgi:hypothetical protein